MVLEATGIDPHSASLFELEGDWMRKYQDNSCKARMRARRRYHGWWTH